MRYVLPLLVALLIFNCVSVRVDTKKTMTNKTTPSHTPEIKRIPPNTSHDVSMYPEAKAGYQRHSIILDEKQNEDDVKLELYVGTLMMTDCNTHTLVGHFTEAIVEGWGYPYWEFSSDGHVRSTRMACIEDTKIETFVHGEKRMLRYNSKLPIVIYTPQGYDVHYTIWEKHKTIYTTGQ